MVQSVIRLDAHSDPFPCGPALEQMGESRSLSDAPLFDLAGLADDSNTFAFVSSGAEAIGSVHWTAFMELARKEGKCHFAASAAEDAAVMLSLKRLEELGCYAKIAPLGLDGRIDLAALEQSLGPRTALLTVSLAHALTGVIQPIEEIAHLAAQKGTLLHVDVSYAIGKIPLADLGADYLTFAGDLIHSVSASGALFAKAGRSLQPLVLGARPDVSSRSALSTAAKHAGLFLDSMGLETARLRDRFEEKVLEQIPNAKPLFRESPRLPNVSLLSFPRVHQEALCHALQRKQLFASIGGGRSPHLSRHLIGCGFDEHTAQTAIHFSLSRFTTQEEVDRAAQIVGDAVRRLLPISEGLFA